MIVEHRIRQGDTLPTIRHQLKLNGAVIDLTTASVTVARRRRIDDFVLPIAGTVTKVDALNGIVDLALTAADTADEAVYDLEWTLAWVDGRLTIPTDCVVRLHVLSRIGGA